MRWFFNQTDWDARKDFLAQEDLRHERRAHEDSMVGHLESTPPDEPAPIRSSMAQVREANLWKDVGEVKRLYRQKTSLTEQPAPVDDGDELKY